MSRTVNCVKLQRELPGMIYKPFDDDLGQRLYDNVSQEGWQMWLEHSKMIVNEYRLDLASEKAFSILQEQCEAFFFGGGTVERPPDYVAPTDGGSDSSDS